MTKPLRALVLSSLALALEAGCASSTSIRIVLDKASDVPEFKTLEIKIIGGKRTVVDVTGKKFPGEILITDLSTTAEVRIVLNGLSTSQALVAQAAVRATPVAGKTVVASARLIKDALPDQDGDAIPDSVDDCPTVFDPDQRNNCTGADGGVVDLSMPPDETSGPIDAATDGAIDAPGPIDGTVIADAAPLDLTAALPDSTVAPLDLAGVDLTGVIFDSTVTLLDMTASPTDQTAVLIDLSGADLIQPVRDFSGVDFLGVDMQSCSPVINELQTGTGVSGSEEAVEIYNPCFNDISLNGWNLIYRSSAGVSDVNMVSWTNTTIGAHQFLLYAGSPSTSLYLSGLRDGPLKSPLSGAGGGLGLKDNLGVYVDSVGYGTATNIFVEGMVAPAPGDTTPPKSISRVVDGVDSNVNKTDFAVTTMTTPRAANVIQ